MRKNNKKKYEMKIFNHFYKITCHNQKNLSAIQLFLKLFSKQFGLLSIFYIMLQYVSFVFTGVPGIEFTELVNDRSSKPAFESKVLVGTSTSLPCNITPPTSEDVSALILWYKEGVKNPIYTVDARKNQTKFGHFVGQIFRDRVIFNVKHPVSFLKIDPVLEKDKGFYKCRVDFKRGRTINHIIHLNVIVPCKEVIIYDQNNNIIDNIAGPFNEGSNVNLTCESKDGNPSPNVTWWKGSTLIDDSYQVTEKKTTVNVLQIKSIDRKNLMSRLTCKVSNNNITKAVIQAISIDLNLKPKEIKITNGAEFYMIGHKYQLTCQAFGSRPSAKIFWYKNDHQLNSTSDTVSDNGLLTTSQLEFVPSFEDNNKQIICNAINEKFLNFVIKDEYKLNISFAPILSLALGANVQHEDIMKGSDVFFECNIQGNPQIFQTGWLFNQNVLESDDNLRFFISNNSLLIKNVDHIHKGTYQCWANNSIGKGESEVVTLKVKYPPFCKAKQRVYYGIAKNEKTTIVCQVDSDPVNVVFHWSFNSSSLGLIEDVEKMKEISFESKDTKSVATYTPKTSLDYGVMYCWAENSIGLQKEPCIFFIIPSDIPGPPEKCAITNTTAHTLTVECIPGYNGGLDQIFHLEVYINSSFEKRFVNNLTSSEYPFFIANSLPSGNTFYLVTYASNLKGKSSKVVITGNTLIAEKWKLDYFEKTGISGPIMVLILAIIALVLFSILIISIFRMRGHRKNKKDENRAFKSHLVSLKSRNMSMENFIQESSNEIISDIYDPAILQPGLIIGNESNLKELKRTKSFKKMKKSTSVSITPYVTSDSYQYRCIEPSINMSKTQVKETYYNHFDENDKNDEYDDENFITKSNKRFNIS